MEGDARSGRAGRTVARSHCVRARTPFTRLCACGWPSPRHVRPRPPWATMRWAGGSRHAPSPLPPRGEGVRSARLAARSGATNIIELLALSSLQKVLCNHQLVIEREVRRAIVVYKVRGALVRPPRHHAARSCSQGGIRR